MAIVFHCYLYCSNLPESGLNETQFVMFLEVRDESGWAKIQVSAGQFSLSEGSKGESISLPFLASGFLSACILGSRSLLSASSRRAMASTVSDTSHPSDTDPLPGFYIETVNYIVSTR